MNVNLALGNLLLIHGACSGNGYKKRRMAPKFASIIRVSFSIQS